MLPYIHDKSILYVSFCAEMVFCTLRRWVYIHWVSRRRFCSLRSSWPHLH